MVVEKGYKQTEVGIIPEEWEVKKVQDLINDYSIISHLDGNHGELYPRSHEFQSSGVPYIGANDFYNCRVVFSNCKYLSPERALQFNKGVAKDGDVLFAHNATVGPVAFLKTELDFVILSTTATYYRCDCKKLNNQFLLYALQAPSFVKQYTAVMSQSTRFQVPITAQRKFYLVLPCIKEQTAIASALSDMDELIAQTEKLIEKKKAIKQGVMQELLRPKEGWVKMRLGDVFDIEKGAQLNRSTLDSNSEFPVYNGGIAPSGFTSSYNTQENTIIISEGGNSCGYVNFIKTKFWRGGHCYEIRPNNYFDKYFAYFLLKYNEANIMALRVGSGLPNIQRSNLAKYYIKYPDLNEQKQISDILMDLQSSFDLLNDKLEKLKLQKQGMMQALLTGKIRLV